MVLPSAPFPQQGRRLGRKLEHNRILMIADSTVHCRLLSYRSQFIQVRSEIATRQGRLQLPLQWSNTHLQLSIKLCPVSTRTLRHTGSLSCCKKGGREDDVRNLEDEHIEVPIQGVRHVLQHWCLGSTASSSARLHQACYSLKLSCWTSF